MLSQSNQTRPWLQASLGILCLVLLAGLVVQHFTITKDQRKRAATLAHFSNQWALADSKVKEQKSVNLVLERQFDSQSQELISFSNQVAAVSAGLVQSQEVVKAQASKVTSTVSQQDSRIASLEQEKNGMASKIESLVESISKLESQIAQAEGKLVTSQNEREALAEELRNLRAQKADLERRFNDLAALTAQIRKIRSELTVSRRVDWIRRSLQASLRGEQLLRQSPVPTEPSNFNLDVEIHQKGEAKVVPTSDSISRTNTTASIQ